MSKPKNILEILVGLRVMATKDCGDVKKGDIYVVEQYDVIYISDKIGSRCTCIDTWQLLDEIHYVPPKHECEFKCSCGSVKK